MIKPTSPSHSLVVTVFCEISLLSLCFRDEMCAALGVSAERNVDQNSGLNSSRRMITLSCIEGLLTPQPSRLIVYLRQNMLKALRAAGGGQKRKYRKGS